MNVHVDAWWKAPDVKAWSPKKVMHVSGVTASGQDCYLFRSMTIKANTFPKSVLGSIVSPLRLCFSPDIQRLAFRCRVRVSLLFEESTLCILNSTSVTREYYLKWSQNAIRRSTPSLRRGILNRHLDVVSKNG